MCQTVIQKVNERIDLGIIIDKNERQRIYSRKKDKYDDRCNTSAQIFILLSKFMIQFYLCYTNLVWVPCNKEYIY